MNDLEGIGRSSAWEHFRNQILKARGNKCELSGLTLDLEVHHIIPFHLGVLTGRGYIELDERNLIVLTKPLHLLLGHLDNWQSFNLNVRQMTPYSQMSIDQILSNKDWMILAMHRPKPWRDMTDNDKTAVTHLIDTLYPIGATI